MEFFDPKFDMAFKKLFGSRHHTGVTIAFLNTILEYTGDKQIESITFNNVEQIPELRTKKEHILDVMCTDKAGRQFIIEMQNSPMKSFDKRIVYYGTMAYGTQLDKARPYTDLQPVATVAITNDFIAIPRAKEYKSIQRLMDVKTLECYFEDLTVVYVELMKFNKQEHELVTDEDKWLFLLKEINNYDHIPAPLHENEFQEACELLNKITWTDTERAFYIKDMLDAQAAQDNMNEAHQKGEIKKAREIAKKMLAMGLDIKTITQATQISEKEIEKLQAQSKNKI